MGNPSFSFSLPTAVRFGEGVSSAVAEVLPAPARRVALLRGGKGVASEPVAAKLAAANLTVTEVPCAGEPSVESVNEVLDLLAPEDIEVVVACGGGAVLDTGKAVAFCLGQGLRLTEDFSEIPALLLGAPGPVPCVAIPTTAGTGAEVTANAVLDLASQGAKVSLRGRALIPATALVDPLLLRSAPPATVLASGLDAVVQTIEAYTSSAATPFSDAICTPNIDSGLQALRELTDGDPDPEAWRTMAWVSLSSGIALANGGLGAAHGIASVVGGRYDAPHGALCGRLLAPVLRQNALSAPEGSEGAARVAHSIASISQVYPPLPDGDALSGFEAWQAALGLPRLGDFGVEPDALDDLAVRSANASSSKKNTVMLGVEAYRTILQAAL